jgi:Glycosyl transferase family 8
MTVESPIKIFVGTEKEQMLALKVLEYSICKHSSFPINITPLFEAIERANIKIPAVKDKQKQPKTPFSFQRFAIPELKEYRGRAIYLDSDMQVFKDIKELWLHPFNGADILSICEPKSSGRASQFSVMVLNCDRLTWQVRELIEDLNRGKWTYEQLMFELAPTQKISQVLSPQWNNLEGYQAGETALTHYTDMPNQPWLNINNPLGWLWCQELFEAIDNNFISFQFVEEQVQKGWVRPSLIYQFKNKIIDPLALPEEIIIIDKRQFTPPHALRKNIRFLINETYLPQSIKRIVYRLYTEIKYLYKEKFASSSH